MFEAGSPPPQLVLNYAASSREAHFEARSRRQFEAGVALFRGHPHSLRRRCGYLTSRRALRRRTKLERARGDDEQALDGCPADESRKLFLLYAKLEEEHGLSRNAMAINRERLRPHRQSSRSASTLQRVHRGPPSSSA